jgi:prepilin-type N-terminal cleavage/methylation domain-containing protein
MLNKAFTLIELLIAMAIGSIVLIAGYAMFGTISDAYYHKLDVSKIEKFSSGSLRLLSKDIKMAGYQDLESIYPDIDQAIISQDSNTDANNSDGIYITYDTSPNQRIRVHYRLRTYLDRFRLYRSVGIFDGTTYNYDLEQTVIDYVTDLQFKYNLFDGTTIDGDITTAQISEVASVESSIDFISNREVGLNNDFLEENFITTSFIRNIGYQK